MANEKELEAARRIVDGWHLGQTSSHYENGGHGPETISTGKGDHGGVSYGTYQLSSKMGTVQEFLEQSTYKKSFAGLKPDTDAFNTQWRDLAKKDPAFAAAQHDFIQSDHYGPQNERLKSRGIDLTDRGHAVQDAIWSTSVQFRSGAPNIFSKGLEEKFGKDYKLSSLSDRDIIEAVQDYKVQHNEALFQSSSAKVREGTLNRAQNEKVALLRLAAAEHTVTHKGEVPEWAPKGRASAQHEHGTLRQGAHSNAVGELQTKLGQLGYTSADGKPLQADGSLGPGTKHAIKAFQHDRHLKEDGVPGPATLKAIEAELRELGAKKQAVPLTSSPPQITDAAHPGHPMFSQAQGHLQKINAQHGLPCTPQTDNAAACVAATGKQAGLTRIDHLALGGTNGDKLIAAQGQPGSVHSKVIDVPTLQALNTPITQSSLAFVEAQQAQHATKQPSQQTQQQTAPALAH